MDDARFDALAKTVVATVGSRRRLLGVLTAGLLGASAVGLSGDRALAKNKNKKQKKKKKKAPPPTAPLAPLPAPTCSTGCRR